MTAEALKCDECGTDDARDDVQREVRGVWIPGGPNCFSCVWKQDTRPLTLCAACSLAGYCVCHECGALIDADHYGTGYLPDFYDAEGMHHFYNGETICPGCYPKKQGTEQKQTEGKQPDAA